MTNKIFNIATFVLLAWLSVTFMTTSKRIDSIEPRLVSELEVATQRLDTKIAQLDKKQNGNYEELVSQVEAVANKPAVVAPVQDPAQTKALNKKVADLKKKLDKHTRYAALKKAYKTVLETELERNDSGAKAAEKLLSTKGVIWKASLTHASEKKNLQGLMGPIDSLAKRWKSGETNVSVKPVYKVLKQTLSSLDANI